MTHVVVILFAIIIDSYKTGDIFSRDLRSSLISRSSRASARSRGSQKQTAGIPNRALNNNVADDYSNIPAVYVSGSAPKKVVLT